MKGGALRQAQGRGEGEEWIMGNGEWVESPWYLVFDLLYSDS